MTTTATAVDDVLSLPGLTPRQLTLIRTLHLKRVSKITVEIMRKARAAVRSTTFKGLCAVLLELAAILAEKGEDISGARVQQWTLRKLHGFSLKETERELAAFLADV